MIENVRKSIKNLSLNDFGYTYLNSNVHQNS